MIIKVTIEFEGTDYELPVKLERDLREARGGVVTLNAAVVKDWSVGYPMHSLECSFDPCDCGLLK